MSNLVNNPRVEESNPTLFFVTGPLDRYVVCREDEAGASWSASPMLGGASSKAAKMRNIEDRDRWAAATTSRHESLDAALWYALGQVGGR